MASTYLTRTLTGTGSNTIFTYSAWLKRSNITSDIPRFFEAYNVGAGGSLYYSSIRFRTDQNNELEFYSEISGSPCQLRTNRVFRDTNAWYHIVLTVDTTNATADDRMKLWINGVQETSFSIRTNPSLNQSLNTNNSGNIIYLGRKSYDATDYFNGLMTHVHFIDGTAYDADTFGQTDATTGIWKPKTAPSVTYGTNGFFLKFENSGAFGTDSSGNGNTFTVNGTMTQTIDTPSNVFCTLNPLHKTLNALSFSNGNTTISELTTDGGCGSTLAVSKGKYYWEVKNVATGGSGANAWVAGIIDSSTYPVPANINNNGTAGLYFSGNAYKDTTDLGNFTSQIANNDIVGVGFDVDNGDIYFWKNGTALNSGNAVITGLDTSKTWMVFGVAHPGANTNRTDLNFGNGYFGTTAVASANADDNGIGVFEYAPPTGFLALCTKNINEQEYS